MTRKSRGQNPWAVLRTLIQDLEESARADEMKGGGDPNDMDVREAEYKLARAKVLAHIADMERREDNP